MSMTIDLPIAKIEAFCCRNGIRRLALFGSVLRDDFSPESDVDILIEFHAGIHVGLGFFRMEQELTELLGRKVDLNTPGFISSHFRDGVIKKAKVLYEAA